MKALLFCLLIAGCTDAQQAKIGAYGSTAHVTCYSGERVIFDGRSTGKVISETSSDGYFFRDAADQKLKEVSGNCVIIYGE